MLNLNFCHIYPTAYLEQYAVRQRHHLCLAHLIEASPEYADFYARMSDRGDVIIMDNSAFEMYKQGRPMYDPDKLVEMAQRVGATFVVMSDYPAQHSYATIKAAEKQIPILMDAGFKTFFVPQSEIGALDQYLDCIDFAINHPHIDLIGLSILGCPNAFGVEKSNNLQRFLSRWKILKILDTKGKLTQSVIKRFHCLGMVDGPYEIELLREYHKYIYSWDSSSAFWAGAHGIAYDRSPTGLINGKFELEVDFDMNRRLTDAEVLCVETNLEAVNRLCGGV